MKPYVFNGNNYNDLNSLGIAYKENFELGINDIFNNTKNLIKFVKTQTKNKDRIQNIIDDLTYSKYKENALTFIIFEFLDVKEVIINGVSLKFDDFINELKVNKRIEKNILFAFLEDHGITRCYKRLEPDKKMFKDSYYIERNFKDPFTYLYLTEIQNFEIKEQPEKKLEQIAIQNEECFRRATKVIRNTDFMLAIAKRFGFKEAITIIKEKNPVFYTVKLFKTEIDEEQLNRLINDGFYWWLFNNYREYFAKGKAKRIMIRLNLIKNEYDKYQQLIKNKEISKIAFDFYSDISRKLYLCYLEFVHYFREGLITVKNENKNLYQFDKPYCNTYITEDYMKGRVIKLYEPKKSEEPKYNVLTGELIESDEVPENIAEDYLEDKPVDPLDSLEDSNIFKKETKVIKKNLRFAFFTLFLSIILTVVVVAPSVIKFFDFDNKYIEYIKDSYKFLYVVSGCVASGFGILFSLVYISILNKKLAAYDDYLYYKKANLKEELTLKQEATVYNIEKNLNKIEKLIKRNYKTVGFISCISLSILASVAGIVSTIFLGHIIDDINPLDLKESITYMLGSILGPLLFAFIVGTFVKKKGAFNAIFIVLIALGISIGLGFIL